MTAPRVGEEEVEAASLVLSTLADNRYKQARSVLDLLASERAALEAEIAKLRARSHGNGENDRLGCEA